jgi:RNA polymerase sigma factor (sigma-70 family)
MARSLRSLWTAATRPASLPTDADLLERFVGGADHSAFELLVRRHAAAVWAACRGILRNDADADDAVQVTFFTLARHTRSVRAGANLGGWLHRVAVHAALKLRAKRRPAVELSEGSVAPAEADDSAAVLHEELAKLPASSREVLVAVDLEGYTHTDAARVLGWPVGTVSGRLVRARAELRRRLERRGITAAVVGATVSGSSIRAAVDVAVGAAVAPAVVVSLSTEVWAMLATSPRKLVAAVACVLGLVLVGGAGMVAVAQSPKPTDPPKATEKKADVRKPVEKLADLPKVEAKDGDPPEVKAAKEVMTAVLGQIKMNDDLSAQGLAPRTLPATLVLPLIDLTAAADDAFPDPKDRLPWYEYRLAVLRQVEQDAANLTKVGLANEATALQTKAERAKAELALLKLKKQIKK